MTEISPDRLDRIEALLERLTVDVETVRTDVETVRTDVETVRNDVETVRTDVEALKQEVTRTNDRVEIYQKSSQQVVNLAFGLIVAATAAIVVPAILGR